MNGERKATILSLAHCPEIVRASVVPVDFIVLSDLADTREIVRHYDQVLKATVPCECRGVCLTQRTDHFVAGLQWYAPDTWQQVVLHFSEGGWNQLMNQLAHKQLQMKGVWGNWKRNSSAPTSPVSITLRGPSQCTHPPVDIGYVLTRRLRLAVDFFGSKISEYGEDGEQKDPVEDLEVPVKQPHPAGNGIVPAVLPRHLKPRVSKGCAPCHRRKKDSSN